MESILFPTAWVCQPLTTQAELNGSMSRRTQKPVTWCDEEQIGGPPGGEQGSDASEGVMELMCLEDAEEPKSVSHVSNFY